MKTKTKRVDIDFPAWMARRISQKAEHVGVKKQELIKMWVGERLAKDK